MNVHPVSAPSMSTGQLQGGPAHGKGTIRASIDVGSGDTKVTVADVNHQVNKISKIWLQTVKTVELRKDLTVSKEEKCLSKKITLELIDAIKTIQEKGAVFQPLEWTAVGTSVFRTAKNGKEVLESVKEATGISIRLIPQLDEAKIGFASAVAASGEDPENVIAWDSGSGSFQISTMVEGKLEMYGAEFAHVPTIELLFALRKQPFSRDVSLNPVSLEEALELIDTIKKTKLPEVPSWLVKQPKKVIGIGGYSIFGAGNEATGKSTYTQHDILEAIKQNCGKSDSALSASPYANKLVVCLVLLYSVMSHCGFEQITYCETNGICEGLLITPEYWQPFKG